MGDVWTVEELEAAAPFGTVNIQDNDGVRLMTRPEYDEWISIQAGKPKVTESGTP